MAAFAAVVGAKCGLPQIQVMAILGGAFDPTRNALELALRLDDRLRLGLADVTATIVTDADVTKGDGDGFVNATGTLDVVGENLETATEIQLLRDSGELWQSVPATYFDVAMTGRLGFELHPKDLTPEEVAFAKTAVADYKRIRPVVQRGDLYRLVSPYEKPLAALMYASEAKAAAALFALGLKIDGERTETLKLRGLDTDARYSVCKINCGARRHASIIADAMAGRDLMERGLAVTLCGDYDSAVFEVRRVCGGGCGASEAER